MLCNKLHVAQSSGNMMLSVLRDSVGWSSGSVAGIACHLGVLRRSVGLDCRVWSHMESRSFTHSFIRQFSGPGIVNRSTYVWPLHVAWLPPSLAAATELNSLPGSSELRGRCFREGGESLMALRDSALGVPRSPFCVFYCHVPAYIQER